MKSKDKPNVMTKLRGFTIELLTDRLDQLPDWKNAAPEETERYNQQEQAIKSALKNGRLCLECQDVLSDYESMDGWVDTASKRRALRTDLARAGLLEVWRKPDYVTRTLPTINVDGVKYWA